MPRRCDIWRIGIVRESIAAIAARGALEGMAVDWLPEQPAFTFLADPFGIERGAQRFVFAESYDYRMRHGLIDCLTVDSETSELLERRTVLREPWHLSYPFVFEAEGACWMLPEASRSGTLRLYRARVFPDLWERAGEIALDVPAIDATPLFYGGCWWLFYSGGSTRRERLGSLRLAWAPSLAGPWQIHRASPIIADLRGGRPGGTPFVSDGKVVLPVQDGSQTYGGALRFLRFTRLDRDAVETELGPALRAPAAFAPYAEGLHTLSACGGVTLIDAKRIDRTGRGWLLDATRLIRDWRAARRRVPG